jgi:hypothetical protein
MRNQGVARNTGLVKKKSFEVGSWNGEGGNRNGEEKAVHSSELKVHSLMPQVKGPRGEAKG